MSLDLQQVLPQVELLGQEAARRAAEVAARLPQASRWLDEAARLDPAELRRRLANAPATSQPALPTDERIDRRFPLPPHPTRLRLMAADGSQIYPDRHAPAFFYMLNIGSVAMVHGSGQPPQVHTRSSLHYQEEEVHDSRGLPIDTLVNAQRDAAEIAELARLAAEGEEVETPMLALLDNGLLLWAASQEQRATRPDVQKVLGEVLAALDRLHASGAALAGYISRPRGANVVALAEAAGGASPGALRGLTDRALFGSRLDPGARSARFLHPADLNQTFAERGHAIQFFYLHTGAQDGVARVEVPAWVGDDPQRLAMVHAGIVEQCRITGIPYPLVRAHELALVGQNDRRALDDLVRAALVRQGLTALASQKAQTKRWTARRRRHRL